jgi:hypothetical protein
MILPDRNIAPDRALLTIGGIIFARLSEPMTVSRLWDQIRELNEKRPLSYVWFLLALECRRHGGDRSARFKPQRGRQNFSAHRLLGMAAVPVFPQDFPTCAIDRGIVARWDRPHR